MNEQNNRNKNSQKGEKDLTWHDIGSQQIAFAWCFGVWPL